jgi:hypothetical protein
MLEEFIKAGRAVLELSAFQFTNKLECNINTHAFKCGLLHLMSANLLYYNDKSTRLPQYFLLDSLNRSQYDKTKRGLLVSNYPTRYHTVWPQERRIRLWLQNMWT